MITVNSVTANGNTEFGTLQIGDEIEISGKIGVFAIPHFTASLSGKGKKGTPEEDEEIKLQDVDVKKTVDEDGNFTVKFSIPFGTAGEDTYRVKITVDENMPDDTGHTWSNTFVVEDPTG